MSMWMHENECTHEKAKKMLNLTYRKFNKRILKCRKNWQSTTMPLKTHQKGWGGSKMIFDEELGFWFFKTSYIRHTLKKEVWNTSMRKLFTYVIMYLRNYYLIHLTMTFKFWNFKRWSTSINFFSWSLVNFSSILVLKRCSYHVYITFYHLLFR